MLLLVIWLCWFGAASLYAARIALTWPRLRTPGAVVLATSALLVFYVPVREYLRGPYVEEAFADLSVAFEFFWVVAICGPLHFVSLLILVRRHFAERGRDERKVGATDP